MHQYKIQIYEYTEDNRVITHAPRYFDSPEQAKTCYSQYKGVKREDGKNLFRVDFMVCAYKVVSDPEAFFAQFEV